MRNCDIKRIKATKLCRGDLKHLVEIQSRTLDPSGFDTNQPVETFTTIRQQWVAIETVSGVRHGVAKFARVNILDDSTHLFWCFWDADLPAIENRNNFILHDNRRFKVLKIDNINELNTVVAIQTTERGDNTEEASKA